MISRPLRFSQVNEHHATLSSELHTWSCTLCVCVCVCAYAFVCCCSFKVVYQVADFTLSTSAGIGSVPSINISASFIQWLEPVFNCSDIIALSYNVSVSGADLSPLAITTNETKFCLELTPCQEYTVTVTPFSTSPDYTGASKSKTVTIHGGNIWG